MLYQWLLLFCMSLAASLAYAEESEDLRIIQARADLPSIQAWLNLPHGRAIKLNEFAATVGAENATITAIDNFEQSADGIAYIFLVDISQSMSVNQFAQIQHALNQWVTGMRKQDRAAIMTFGRSVATEIDFSDDKARLNQVIQTLSAQDKETSLYRGLLEAINLGRRMDNNLPARRAIVMLTDGLDDTVSGVTLDEVLRLNAEHRVPIYSIGYLAPPLNDKKRQGLKVLGQLSRQSGGNFVRTAGDELDNAYQLQRQHIMQSYRMLIDCARCIADGQAYRLNLIWNNGDQSVSDGLDIRLLPKPGSNPAATNNRIPEPAPAARTQETRDYYPIIISVLVVITFGVVLIVMMRQRQVAPLDDIEEVLAHVQAAKPHLQPVEDAQASSNSEAMSSSARLTVLMGSQKGRVYLLPTHRRTIVGRAPNCDVQIVEDLEVSGQHAQIQFVSNQLTLRDLNSTNGTEVNGVPIHNDYPLHPGDVVQIGRTELRFDWPDFKS